MGLLSDFFIAKPDAVKTYGGDSQLLGEDCCQYKHLSPLQAAQILAVLRGTEYDLSLLDEFPLAYEASEDGPWTVQLPDDMVSRLAELNDSDVAPQALAWARETEEELGWGAAEFESIVRDLIRLARAARASGKSMYLWNCL